MHLLTSEFRSGLRLAATIALAAALTACGGLKEEHETIDLDASLKPKRTRLELPPDLLASASEAVANVASEVESVDEEVIPETVGVTVLDDGARRWLEVEAPAEEVWPRLVRYWGEIGAPLIVADPQTGVMETDWVSHDRKDGSKSNRGTFGGFVVNLFKDITDQDTSLDKYTLRMERTEDGKTQVFLTHRGSRKLQTNQGSIARDPEWEWVETGQDPEKIALILQSIRYSLGQEPA